MIDSEVGTSWMVYIEVSKEEPDVMDNVEYQTVKDGADIYLDA